MAEQDKLMGRPKMTSGRRTRKLDVRFTDEEYGVLLSLEKELGMKRTELVRMRVLNDGAALVVNAKQLISVLNGIGAEMGRSGNNINQLAKHANTLKLQGAVPPYILEQYNDLLTEYIAVQQQLESALRKIIRLMGK